MRVHTLRRMFHRTFSSSLPPNHLLSRSSRTASNFHPITLNSLGRLFITELHYTASRLVAGPSTPKEFATQTRASLEKMSASFVISSSVSHFWKWNDSFNNSLTSIYLLIYPKIHCPSQGDSTDDALTLSIFQLPNLPRKDLSSSRAQWSNSTANFKRHARRRLIDFSGFRVSINNSDTKHSVRGAVDDRVAGPGASKSSNDRSDVANTSVMKLILA